jgi:hypothetical protein
MQDKINSSIVFNKRISGFIKKPLGSRELMTKGKIVGGKSHE